MRQFVLVLTAVIGFTSAATGGEELWKKYSKAAVGRYVAEGVIPTDGDVGELRPGNKFVMESTLSVAADGYALVGNQVLTVPEKPDQRLHSTITSGWDPVDEAIEIAVYWSNGLVERATLDGLKGNTLTGTNSLLTSDGSVESADVEMVITDNDHHVWKFAGGPDAGKPLSHWQRVKAVGREDTVPEKVLKLAVIHRGDTKPLRNQRLDAPFSHTAIDRFVACVPPTAVREDDERISRIRTRRGGIVQVESQRPWPVLVAQGARLAETRTVDHPVAVLITLPIRTQHNVPCDQR